MKFGKFLHFACAAIAALLPQLLLAQVTNPPLAPVPSYMVTPGITGPITTYQPAVPPANNGQFIVPETYGGAPVMGPGMVCPPACPPMCPQPCPPANFDPYYSPLPSTAAPVATMPGGINWNNSIAGTGITPRFGAGYLDGEHVGLDDGYIWLEGWAPLWQTPGQNVFFVDVNTLKYNDGSDQWGFNGHAGYRYFNCASNRICGFYLGYDYRDVGPAEFEQISGGVESLGALWDFRANFYWVFDTESELISVSPPFFVGNNIAVNTTNLDAYSGFDAEVGRNFTPNNPTLAVRGFLGGYGFRNDNAEDVWGGRARLEARWWNRFTLEAGVNHDQTFDTTVWLAGSILFGGSQTPTACGCPPTIVDRLADPIYMNRHIVVNDRVEQELLLNPIDNQPFEILHIDSNAPGGGTGAFEAPLNALANAAANIDIVLLHAGSNFVGQSITMDDPGQRLLGDGNAVRHTITSQFGTQLIPRANGLAAQPIISNAVGTAVNVNAANVEVSGLDIRQPFDHGISVNLVEGFNINRNVITGANADLGVVGEGINVNLAGIANGTGNISENIVTGGRLNGIAIATGGGGSFDGTVIDNQSTGNLLDGFLIGQISGGTFSGNVGSGNGDDGFDITTIGGGTFTANSAAGNNNHGFEIVTISGGTVTNNTATANTTNGYLISAISGGTVSGNSALNNGANGFGIVTQSGGTFSGNNSFANGADGFFWSALTGGLVDSNVATSNTDDGFDINAAFSGGQFNNNLANTNGNMGYEIVAPTAPPGSAVNNNGAGNVGGGDNFAF